MLASRLAYYLTSIPTLLLGVRNWPTMAAVSLGVPVRRPLVVRARPRPLAFHVRSAMDVWTVKETCLDHFYDLGRLRAGDVRVVVDLGAGFGDFAIYAASRYPRSTVYAYEPSPESFVMLQENVRLNRAGRVHAFPYAVVGRAAGPLTLYTGTRAKVQHTLVGAGKLAAGRAVEVETVALADVFREHGIDRCDLLKIDCEGAEYDIILQSDAATIGRISHIAMEYHDGVTAYSHRDLAAFLRRQGFQISLRRNQAHAELGYLYAWRP
ncbi:MAG TPA: FkbM family methyltransferase [Chloroflexota bacterium]|nr:FkbM family methyltransferase [Chloroflexota bacterium]